MAATSTESKGIHKIPNELLIEIIAFVPFIRRGFLILPKLGYLGSHVRLRQVDHRFRDIVDSAALRLQTVRCQFPELAALRGITTVSFTKLINFSLIDANVRQATDKVLKKDGDESAKHAIFTSLHLLDYMTSVVNNDKQYDLTNACLLTWAKMDLFSSKWLQVLRYALHCVFDHLFPTIEDFALIIYDSEDPWGVVIRQQGDTGMADIPRTLRRRCLDSAILLQNHAGSLHAEIIQQEDPPDFVNHFAELYGRLCSILIHRCAVTTGIALELADEKFEDDLDFVQGMQWCMLSDEQGDESVSSQACRVSQIVRPYIREASNDAHLHRKFEDFNVSDAPSISIKEMEDAGSFLRKAYTIIATKDVPDHLNRFARLRGLSFIMSMSDDNDESESDDEEEDADGTDKDSGSDGEGEAESGMDNDEDNKDDDYYNLYEYEWV